MKERSGMPYDVVAFENDELAFALSLEEEGIFHRMLRKAWMNGSVPADLNELAYLCRVNPRTMKKAWPKLAPLWTPIPGNASRIFSKKLESERNFLEHKRKVAQENANARWNSKKTKKPRHATALQDSNASHPSPSHPIPISTKDDSSPVSTDVLALGEHGHARLTPAEHEKLKVKLNSHTGEFIKQFDEWVHTAPDAKHQGIRRKDRDPYASICQWYDRAVKEGRVKSHDPPASRRPTEEAIRREEQLQFGDRVKPK